jgi:hypothetical protein
VAAEEAEAAAAPGSTGVLGCGGPSPWPRRRISFPVPLQDLPGSLFPILPPRCPDLGFVSLISILLYMWWPIREELWSSAASLQPAPPLLLGAAGVGGRSSIACGGGDGEPYWAVFFYCFL